MFKGNCDNDLLHFYGVDPEKVDWIEREEYIAAPIEEVKKLMEHYRIYMCSDEEDKLFLIPHDVL